MNLELRAYDPRCTRSLAHRLANPALSLGGCVWRRIGGIDPQRAAEMGDCAARVFGRLELRRAKVDVVEHEHALTVRSGKLGARAGGAESREVVYDDHQLQPLVRNYKQIMSQMSRQ